MTTTPGFLSGTLSGTQDLFTISYPYVNISAQAIANVSKADPAVVTSTNKLPGGMVDGTEVLITDVAGMTELATAGVGGSSKFYANVLTTSTFSLYTDAALTTGVDSTGFTNATANTGAYNTFTVPQYNSVTSPAIVVFDTEGASGGTGIALDSATGIITLDTTLSFLLTATVNTTRTVPATSTAGYQWYNITDDVAIGPFVKFGETATTTITTAASTEVALKVYSDTSTFENPNQLFGGSFTVEVIGGYTV